MTDTYIARLEALLAERTKALEFYADEGNWRLLTHYKGEVPKCAIIADGGTVAKLALADTAGGPVCRCGHVRSSHTTPYGPCEGKGGPESLSGRCRCGDYQNAGGSQEASG